MVRPNLLACLICTCKCARKWQRISVYLAGQIQEHTSKTDWALKLPDLALLGSLVRYPKIATKMVDDLDFARRLQCFSTEAFTGLNQYVKRSIKLCLMHLRSVERKQKRLKAEQLKRQLGIQRRAMRIEVYLARRGHP